ncbi:hypothetical protein [Flavobacterium salmonis]|uniref:Lipoprotein n=1 Tax=Flavobacterium salmonis TaxID=2654844 RepID=A0A6V6YPH2_9FLAO|nr:hypothetical protein [Flavobacterium salmonis]CAD0001401.1 hypothetical protein FLAT13_00542 [Flavobacterium salmonis]
MKIHKILFLIIIVLIQGCKKNNEPNPAQRIRDLVGKFPQLIEGKNVKERGFKHIRTVIDGETKVQIQLYSQGERINNSHQIIVFVNKNKKSVAIPLFNNRQRDYWQFANDKLISNVEKVNTTFEKEYNAAISILRKENTFKDALETDLLIELLRSVLHTQRINNETLEMCKIKYAVSDIPVENEDSVRVRFEKNYDEIKENVKNYNITYYCYDTHSHRIYSINYDENKKVYKFKIYRHDFGAEPIKPIYL